MKRLSEKIMEELELIESKSAKLDFKLLPIEQVLRFASDACDDTRYQLKRTKVPNKKRSAQAKLDFWASVEHHLNQVK